MTFESSTLENCPQWAPTQPPIKAPVQGECGPRVPLKGYFSRWGERDAALLAEMAGNAVDGGLPSAPKTHVDKVASLLHSRMRVALSDGRCVRGHALGIALPITLWSLRAATSCSLNGSFCLFLFHSVVIGNFQCFDQEQNLILTESEEIRDSDASATPPLAQRTRRRTLGMVMIPGRHMTKCEVEA